jgi:uncharacterized damage-inducible protein DinB
MKIADVHDLFAYHDWANLLILNKAAQLLPEQYMQPTSFSWGNMHGTLVHLLDSDNGWRLLCQHGQVTFAMKPDEYPTFDSLTQRWAHERTEMWAYLNSLSDDDMQKLIVYEVEEGTRRRLLWHCLFHVVNHGMQHRSECAAMLTDFGQSPGDLDFTHFLNERAAGKV